MTDPGLSSEYINPRKRPKLEPDSDTDNIDVDVDEKPFVNHPTLYFDDGNVILTTGRTLFCVHRSLLSKHSPVFGELFEREHDTFRDLMKISMKETPEDLEALLGVIYDGLRLDVQDLTVESFPTLAALLRMSKHYQIERPCQDIVARIRAEWPAVLAQHDAKEAKLNAGHAIKDCGQLGGDVKPPPNIVESLRNVQPRVVNPMPPLMPPPVPRMAPPLPIRNYGMQTAGNQNLQQLGAYLGLPVEGMFYPAPRPGNNPVMGGVGRGGGGVGYPPPPRHINPNALAGPSNARGPGPARGPAPPPAAPHPSPPYGAGAGVGAANAEEDLIVHPASVIGLLRECGYADAQLLFPLFYSLSRTTWQFGGPALGHHLAPLSTADVERFVVGIERVREHHTAFAITVPTLDPSPHQPVPGGMAFAAAQAQTQCNEGIKQLWQGCGSTLLLPVAGRGLARQPLEDLARLAQGIPAQAGRNRVCPACGRALAAKIEAFRRELWAKLPQFFELA
ncbi:hypothetical protein V8D89_000138 [Ganoderma adspersum]